MAWGRSNEQDTGAEPVDGCPDRRRHYVTEVNKGSLNVTIFGGKLNVQYQQGYRLAHVFEQDGNTVQVFEHTHD